MKSNITVHTIVKNEEQWVWYAIQSVINYVDRILVYDTGSRDKTVDIIHSIDSDKIDFKEQGDINPSQLVNLRNTQIEETKTEWFLLLDGDEVWPKLSIKKLYKLLQKISDNHIGIVVKARIPLGDLYHYQGEDAGCYELLGMRGHYNIRAYRKKKGYKWYGSYPLEAYTDSLGKAINDQDDKLVFLKDNEYWHLRHLSRSSVPTRRVKLEIGRKENIELPDVFFKKRADIIPSPWIKFTHWQYFIAFLLTPFFCIKRYLIKNIYRCKDFRKYSFLKQ